MRKIISASLLLLLLFSTARAEEPAPSAELISNDRTPQQVLHDSLQALIDGQPERYVQSLTKEELDFQVGLVLLMSLTFKEQQPFEWDKPELLAEDKTEISFYLMRQNLHLLEKDFHAPEISFAEVEKMSRAMDDEALCDPHFPVSRETYRYVLKIGRCMNDPGSFLTAVLKEIMTPVTDSQGKPIAGYEAEVQKFVKAVQAPTTIFYVRGRHAMAIVFIQEDAPAEQKKTASPAQVAIVMQQTPEGWKISQLLSLMLRGADLQDIINP